MRLLHGWTQKPTEMGMWQLRVHRVHHSHDYAETEVKQKALRHFGNRLSLRKATVLATAVYWF